MYLLENDETDGRVESHHHALVYRVLVHEFGVVI